MYIFQPFAPRFFRECNISSGRGVLKDARITTEGPSGFFMKSYRTQLEWHRRDDGVRLSEPRARKVSDADSAAAMVFTLCIMDGRASEPPG